LALLTLFMGFTHDNSTENNSKPDFVLILTGDQGWNALSTRMDPDIPGSGSTNYHTSNPGKGNIGHSPDALGFDVSTAKQKIQHLTM
jgi:hypothetical protein